MIVDVINILTQRSDLFIELLIEHIAISTVVIVTAGVLGGVVGILISEYSKAVKPTFNVVNFLYTIPSISMLGFLIPMFGVGKEQNIIKASSNSPDSQNHSSWKRGQRGG